MIYETACRLFDELWNKEPIRLLGIHSSKLTAPSEPVQLSLFDLPAAGQWQTQERFPSTIDLENRPVPSREKLAALDKTLDSIRQKYGSGAVMRGSFLKNRKDE